MKMFKSIVSLMSRMSVAILLVIGYTAHADVTVGDFSYIKYWIGTGTNQAALVIDWNDGLGTESYTWGYRWDGLATGEDMVRAIHLADTNLDIGFIFYDNYGYSITSAGYDTDGNGSDDHFADGVGFSSGYWSYWTQETSSPFTSGAWTFSEIGMTARPLADGSWDGWSWAPDFTEPGDDGPDAGIAAVPEPGSALLVISAGSMLFFVNRKRRDAAAF